MIGDGAAALGFASYNPQAGAGNFVPGAQSPARQNPVQPPPDVPGIRTELKKIVIEPKCADFIKELFRLVKSEGNPLVADGDILKIYEIINSPPNVGLIRAGALGSIPGYGTATFRDQKGAATIQVGPGIGVPSILLKIEAQSVLHELIHQAGKERVYLDEELAKVVSGIRLPGVSVLGSPPEGSTQKQKDYFYSNYWGAVLKDKCKYSRRQGP